MWSNWASLEAQLVKNLPAMQETPVRSLGWEDPLEKGMAMHSCILAWSIPWTEKSCRIQSMRSGCTEWLYIHTHTHTHIYIHTHTPGSAIHGIFQARILEWAAISFSSGPSQPRVRTRVSCIADRRFTIWATREALPVQERQVQSLGQEDALEKKMATHFSILEGRIPWTEEPGGLSPWGHKRVRHDRAAKQQICTYILGKRFVINLKDH